MIMKYLAYFRRERGLTQNELAELVEIGVNSIARYERDEVTPSIEIAKAIADALHITVDELLKGPKDDKIELLRLYNELCKGKSTGG